MAFTFDEYRCLYHVLNTLREKVAALTKELESTLKAIRVDPEQCYQTLNFPQLGKLHYRGHTAQDILIDDTKQFFRYIFVLGFVARSPAQTPVRELGELTRSLRDITDAINLMFRNHHIEQLQDTTDSADMEERINEETRNWLEYTSAPNHLAMYPVRNYVIAKSLSDWLDAFQRDLGYLAGDSGSITFQESAMLYQHESVYCVTVTETDVTVTETDVTVTETDVTVTETDVTVTETDSVENVNETPEFAESENQ